MNCFACGRAIKLTSDHYEVWTSDPQMQWVGPECYNKIQLANKNGYQPPPGGPRLFSNHYLATHMHQK